MSEKNQSMDMLKRSDIDEKYKWNLKDIYQSDENWESDFQKARELTKKAGAYSGKLNDSKTLYECLKLRSDLSQTVFNLFQYAHLSLDLDNRESKYQEMNDRAQMLAAEAGASFSFVEPELLHLTDEQLLAMSYKFEKTDLYDFYIKELIRSRSHIRSEEVEELLSLSTTFAAGSGNTFSLLDDADLKYPTIKDEKGEDVQLTKQRYSKFMESSDRRVRKEASDAFGSAYKDHLNSISGMLSTEINKNIFYTKARRYENCLQHALDANKIPTSVYHSLLETTEKNLKGLHKWTALRKKILKLDEIAAYDMACPLFPEYNYEVPYDEAVDKVIESCQPLGGKYVEILKHAFQSRWVDVFETEGKTSGAFSWGNYSTHPYVLMNYSNTIDNMFTLGHELGHCLHSYLSNQTQSYPKAQYSIFVAEVASTLNEGLMLLHLLKKAKSKEEKLFLLNRHLDNTFGTYFNQVLYARFELTIHDHVEKGQALSPDTMTNFFGDLVQAYYGPDLTMDEYSPLKWARIPHFYNNYYVYQYSTSYAASQAILEKFINGEEGIVEKFLELLKSGGSDYPIEQLKKCGVDMTTSAPFEATLKLFEEQVDEVERLAK